MKYTVAWAVGIVLIICGISELSYRLYQHYAPREEAVRREVFEQSKAYNQGMSQEIQNMEFEYVKATPEQKQALRSIILHRVADFDLGKLPPSTREFVNQLTREEVTP